MKHLHLFLLVICILFSSSAIYMAYNCSESSSSNSSCNHRITAIVDNDKMINDSLVLQDLQKQIREQNSKLQEEFEKELEKFKPSKEEFDLLSEEAKKEKAEQFNKYAAQARDDYAKKLSGLEERYKNSVDSIFKKIKEVTKKIAESEKIDLVLFISSKNQVLYSQDGVDLSDKVLKHVNKSMSKFVLK